MWSSVCSKGAYLVCMWDAWLVHVRCMTNAWASTQGEKCIKHTTNDQYIINMNNCGNPKNLVFIGVQNNEKMPFEHFIKQHYTCMLNNAWTYENLT